MADQQDSGSGVGDWNWFGPGETGLAGAGLILLGGTDQKGEASEWRHQCGCDGENGFEALDGAEGDYVIGVPEEGFGARVLYIDVRQCKGAGDFAEEGGLLVIGLDQGEGNLRSPELDGKAREAGAGAQVGQRDAAAGCWHLGGCWRGGCIVRG